MQKVVKVRGAEGREGGDRENCANTRASDEGLVAGERVCSATHRQVEG